MSITASPIWEITNLERNIDNGGVVRVHWCCDLTQENSEGVSFRVSTCGTIDTSPDPDAESFIPFDQLTPEIVMEWVTNTVDVESIEASLTAKLDKKLNPTTEVGLAWQ